ncbi:MAG: lysophospholipase [Porticoccaceae bacterium]|nr:lysophospholipase [Porticoccaceae bacterium]
MKTLLNLFTATLIAFASHTSASEPKSVEFHAADGLQVNADLYMPHAAEAPFIVLFHQAGWSRGAYGEIAPKLNALGFNCMAVDQRSGKAVNGVANLTAQRHGRKASYMEALPDMQAAVDFARRHYANGKLLVWGSSYSASLVFKLAAGKPDVIDGVLSFSPNADARWAQPWLLASAGKLQCPVFVTAAKNEAAKCTPVFEVVPGSHKQLFLPETTGNHGSRALWQRFDDSESYWRAVKEFLGSL